MRALLLVLISFIAIAPAAAETARRPATDRPQAGKVLPLKGAAANPCAAYGQGFVRVAGTGTCVKIGGGIGVGVAVSGGR